ncbi:hypothetical protein AGIG_G15211 [Arapaima gigas]
MFCGSPSRPSGPRLAAAFLERPMNDASRQRSSGPGADVTGPTRGVPQASSHSNPRPKDMWRTCGENFFRWQVTNNGSQRPVHQRTGASWELCGGDPRSAGARERRCVELTAELPPCLLLPGLLP